MAYYAFLIEIALEYFHVKKRAFDRIAFIRIVFETVDSSADSEDIKGLLAHLTKEEKQTLTLRLNYFLHNLDLRRNVYSGLSFETLARDMIRSEITNQQAFLERSQNLIESLLKSIKGSEYELKRSKIENAMQDLIWGRVVKGSVNLTDSGSEKSLSKKELIEKLRICEQKLKQ